MSNPLMHGGNSPQQQPQVTVEDLRNDPVNVIKQFGYNVPAEISNNPIAMIQHLVQSGQIPQSRLQQFANMRRR